MADKQIKQQTPSKCELARTCSINKVSKIGGEDSDDEQTIQDLEEEKYEEQVRLWLRNERALEIQEQARNFVTSPYTDDYRCKNASSYGGF